MQIGAGLLSERVRGVWVRRDKAGLGFGLASGFL